MDGVGGGVHCEDAENSHRLENKHNKRGSSSRVYKRSRRPRKNQTQVSVIKSLNSLLCWRKCNWTFTGGGVEAPEAKQSSPKLWYKWSSITMNHVGQWDHNGLQISVYYSDALAPRARIKDPRLTPFEGRTRNPQVSKLEFHSLRYFCSYEKSWNAFDLS